MILSERNLVLLLAYLYRKEEASGDEVFTTVSVFNAPKEIQRLYPRIACLAYSTN